MTLSFSHNANISFKEWWNIYMDTVKTSDSGLMDVTFMLVTNSTEEEDYLQVT